MLLEADPLPHLICSRPIFIGGVKNEADQHDANFGVSGRRFRFKPAGGVGGNRQAISVQSGTPLRRGFGTGFGEPPLRDTSYLALVC
jgi:hypothetical protein